MIWQRLIKCKDEIVDTLNASCEEYNEIGMDRFNNPNYGWVNRTWKNKILDELTLM
jgi:hypothetical protein